MASPDGTPGGALDAQPQRSWPRLGDLALDTTKHDRIGVIVGTPGEEGSGWLTYHLQPPGGGAEWSAPADASTLRHVPSKVTHATVTDGGLVYDRDGRRWTLGIQLHHDDGSSEDSSLIVTGDQARQLAAQVRGQGPGPGCRTGGA
jgi:hypothetical protein